MKLEFPMSDTVPPRTLLSRFLGVIERGGNALPHPATRQVPIFVTIPNAGGRLIDVEDRLPTK